MDGRQNRRRREGRVIRTEEEKVGKREGKKRERRLERNRV